MARWLALLTIVPLAAAVPAQAQTSGLSAGEVASVARARTLDLRLSHDPAPTRPRPLMRGMIVRHHFAPNAAVGLGLANIYAKRSGSDLRIGERPARSRKPAVSFVFKF